MSGADPVALVIGGGRGIAAAAVRALADGFYISASAGDKIDFAEAAELSALAMEKLVQHYAELGATADQP